MSKGPDPKFRNFYKCSECGTEWQDEWDSTCDDRCPTCNTSNSPVRSEDIESSQTTVIRIEMPKEAAEKLAGANLEELSKALGFKVLAVKRVDSQSKEDGV